MNQSGEEENTEQNSSKNAVLCTKKKVPDNNTAVSPQSIQSNRPIVRKLSEARKMPFQQNLTTKDESKACSSSSSRSTDMPSTKLPPSAPSTSSSAPRFAFNFNAIKNRFAQNCPEPKSDTTTPPIKFTKKRQFDGTKSDTISPTETKSTLRASKATDDNPDSLSAAKLSPVKQNESDVLQSDSKRQKSDYDSPCTSSSSQQKDKFISVVSTTQSIETEMDTDKTTESESEPTTSPKTEYNAKPNPALPYSPDPASVEPPASSSSPYITKIEVSNSTERTKQSEPQTEVDTDDSSSDDDLDGITLHPSFVEQRKKQKELAEQNKAKESESESPSTSSDKDKDDTTKTPSEDQKPKQREVYADPNAPRYWENIFETEYYKSRSLTFNDIMNRDFGFAGRMGHGNRNNFFSNRGLKGKGLIYDQQLQSAREYVRKALNCLGNVRRLKHTQTLSEHEGCVNALNFNGGGSLLISGSDDYRVCIWDWAKSSVILQYESGHRSNVFQTKFVPFSGDTQIVTCARDGQVRLGLISSSGTFLGTKRVAKHADSCHKLAIEPDSSNLFLSCGEDGSVFEIDLRQNTPARILTVLSDRNYKLPLYSVHSNPVDTYQFVVAGRDPYLRVYDKRMLVKNKNEVWKKFCPSHLKDSQRSSITSAVFNHNGTEILGSYSDDDIFLYGLNQEDTEEATYRYSGHRNSDTVKGVNFFGANNDFIVSGSDCGRIFLWEKTSQQVVNVLTGEDSGITNVIEPHPSFPYIATSGLETDIKVWSPCGDEVNNLANLSEIIRENQRVREAGRNFSLSNFEFELLLLLMRRPINRVFVAADADSLENRINAVGVTARADENESSLFGPYSLRRRRGLLAAAGGFGEQEVREFSPVDDDEEEEEEQSYNEEEDEEEEGTHFMNFGEEDEDEEEY